MTALSCPAIDAGTGDEPPGHVTPVTTSGGPDGGVPR